MTDPVHGAMARYLTLKPICSNQTRGFHYSVTAPDLMYCLRTALSQVNPDGQMTTVIGTASAGDPEEVRGSPKPRVLLQWRLDRADEDRLSKEITAWRKRQCHPTNPGVYNVLKKAYDKQKKEQKKEEKKRQKDQPARDPVEIQPTPLPAPKRRHGKSSSPGPSQKRPNIGSQSGTFSPSSSVTSSPEMSRLPAFASPSAPYQQPGWVPPLRLPGPSGLEAGAPSGTGYPYGPSYGQMPPMGPPPGATRPGSSQPTMTAVTRGMSDMALTAPGGYGGPPNVLEPPAGYRPRPVPVQMRHPQPAPGQYEGYGPPPGYGAHPSNAPGYGQGLRNMPPPPIPPQGFRPQGMPPGPPYPPYPFQGSPEDPQGEWSEDPRAVYFYRGGRGSGSQGSHRGGR